MAARSLPVTPALGPHQRVTPTNAAGDANSDAAPTITRSSTVEAMAAAGRGDIDIQVLVELRVISRLLASGLTVTDDVDTLRADEMAGLGF